MKDTRTTDKHGNNGAKQWMIYMRDDKLGNQQTLKANCIILYGDIICITLSVLRETPCVMGTKHGNFTRG
jgi:hypothetical protein